jgi:hypothetical protein
MRSSGPCRGAQSSWDNFVVRLEPMISVVPTLHC